MKLFPGRSLIASVAQNPMAVAGVEFYLSVTSRPAQSPAAAARKPSFGIAFTSIRHRITAVVSVGF